MRTHLSPVQKMTVDLSGTNYHFPQHIAITDSRPDIVLWQDEPRVVSMLELTICFETNFDEARKRKLCRYADLLEEAEKQGYQATVTTVEVGSRGILNMAGLNTIKRLLSVGRKEWATFLTSVSRTVIEESHKIWTARNWRGESENNPVP